MDAARAAALVRLAAVGLGRRAGRDLAAGRSQRDKRHGVGVPPSDSPGDSVWRGGDGPTLRKGRGRFVVVIAGQVVVGCTCSEGWVGGQQLRLRRHFPDHHRRHTNMGLRRQVRVR